MAASARGASALSLEKTSHVSSGIDHVFDFELKNDSSANLRLHGRLVVISVYDTHPAVTLPIYDFAVPAGATRTLEVKWSDAPLVGRVRALLVLGDGNRDLLIDSFDFWIIPFASAAVFGGVLLLLTILALFFMRLPTSAKRAKKRLPQGLAAYVVEDDDTVVSLSNKFEVSWQDIVRANRLHPPYQLRPGHRILIPRHPLKRPEEKI